MRELTQDPFYELIGKEYSRCVIDYRLVAPDFPYRGIRSHREAVLFAMLKEIERYLADQRESEEKWTKEIADDFFPWSIDFGKADFGWDAVLQAPEQIPGMDPPFGEKDGAGDGQYLCIGRIRLPLSDEEFSLLQHLGRQYIDAYGREPGFVAWLQGQLG